MGSDRRRGFEAWARNHGDPAVRGPDRRGIAEDLFEIAGQAEVDEGHIEELSKRYRARFAGAQKVLQVNQVGDEVLRWQNSPRSVPPRSNDARREDDEVIGLELDPLSAMGRAVGLDLATPPPGPSPFAAQPRVAPAPEVMRPALEARAAPASPVPAAPERSRAGGGDWGASPRSISSPRLTPVAAATTTEESGMWAPLRGPSNPPASGTSAPPLSPPLLPPGALPDDGGLPALDAPSRPAPAVASVRPPPAPMVLQVAGESSRPPPSSRAVGPSSGPMAPPLGPPPGSMSPSSSPNGPDGALPAVPLPPPGRLSLRAIPESLRGASRRSLGTIAAGVVGAVVVLGLLARPGCLYGRGAASVQGRFTSKHLGITAAFPESWQHQRALDDNEARGDWDRAVSMFFRGVGVDEFIAQVTVVTLTHDDRPATEVDLRDVARNELAGSAMGRRCLSYDRYGTKAVRCTSVTSRQSRRYGTIEEYFLTGRRIVFARALVEAVPGEMQGGDDAPAPGAGAADPPSSAPTLRGYVSPIAEMDAREIESILDSIEATQD